MTKREELQARLSEANRYREQYDAEAWLIQEQLDALPKERVRLRAEMCGPSITHFYAGERKDRDFFCAVYSKECEEAGISRAALAAHICRFSEPDVTREQEALEAAVRAYKAHWDGMKGIKCGIIEGQKVMEALAALDAARKGGA